MVPRHGFVRCEDPRTFLLGSGDHEGVGHAEIGKMRPLCRVDPSHGLVYVRLQWNNRRKPPEPVEDRRRVFASSSPRKDAGNLGKRDGSSQEFCAIGPKLPHDVPDRFGLTVVEPYSCVE